MLDKDAIAALLVAAQQATGRSISPHSGFKVGAALLDSEGRIFLGANVENPSIMLTICAERVALLKALTEGARDFKAIAVVADGINTPCFPCGTCRQMLMEFAPDIQLLFLSEGHPLSLGIEDLLPHPFKL